MRIAAFGLVLALLDGGVAGATITVTPGMEVYDCTLNVNKRGWIADHMIFVFDPATGKMLVDDGIIEFYAKKPAEALVSKNDAKVLSFTWGVFMTNSRTQSTRMAYRATLFRANNELDITARPVGFADNFAGRGTCVKK